MEKSKFTKSAILLFLRRILCYFIIFIIFSAYLFGLQVKYNNSNSGYQQALFYALLVFGAGLSYDCAKTVFFMRDIKFHRFSQNFLKTFSYLVCVIVLMVFSAISIVNGYIIWGQIGYIFLLGSLWFLLVGTVKVMSVLSE